MREADRITLDTLKAVAPSTDPMVWEVLEKQVAEVGVRGLTGSSQAFVEALVRKHMSPGDKGYGAAHPNSKAGGAGVSGGQGGSGGSAAGPWSGSKDEAIATYGKVMGLGAKEAAERHGDVASHKPVPVASSVGLPSGTKGRVLGYDPKKDSRVVVGFDRPVTIGGKTSDVHVMRAKFDQSKKDDEYMVSLGPDEG